MTFSITVMREIGIDISRVLSNDVFEFFKQGRLYDYVVTVCDETNDAKCPVFPGITQRLHWPFEDPEGLTGTEEEKLGLCEQSVTRLNIKLRLGLKAYRRTDSIATDLKIIRAKPCSWSTHHSGDRSL